MDDEIIVVITPPPLEPLTGRANDNGWSVGFVCNGPVSTDGLRAAKRAIKRKLEELGADED